MFDLNVDKEYVRASPTILQPSFEFTLAQGVFVEALLEYTRTNLGETKGKSIRKCGGWIRVLARGIGVWGNQQRGDMCFTTRKIS